jgi:hypothetical protein
MKPQTCPICQGKGELPMGFYGAKDNWYYGTSDATAKIICRNCNGSGIVYYTTTALNTDLRPIIIREH